jgi:hypothetical protein
MPIPKDTFEASGEFGTAAVLRWLDEGGDPNDRYWYEDGVAISLLSSAAYAGNTVLVRELLARGADPSVADDESNWTALHAAAAQINPAIVASVADAGGAVNLCMVRRVEYDSDGEPSNPDEEKPRTPLMCAAEQSICAEAFTILLSRGADVAATNEDDQTAEDFARKALTRRDVNAPRMNEFDFLDRRLAGEGERILALLIAVRTAGSWKRYSAMWRKELILLQRLCSTDRAFPLVALRSAHSWDAVSVEELEASSGCKVSRPRKHKGEYASVGPTDALMARLVRLPPVLTWNVASYWRTARDPLY